MVWLPLTTAFLQVRITLYRAKTGLKPAMSQLSEPNALSSWATIAYVWKTQLQRISILESSLFPIVVNSWSDYRWPPRFYEHNLRCIEQKQAKNLSCRSCRRTTTSPYRPTLKREFCWFCPTAPKTRKSPLLVVTTGFSGILQGNCTVVVKWWSTIREKYAR